MTFSLKNILFGVIAIVVGSWAVYTLTQQAYGASFPDPRVANPAVASSTAYTLTWGGTATRLVATSTSPGARLALSVQPVNCGTGGVVYLQHNDVAAATTTGFAVFATTTSTYADVVPVVSGSVRAMSAVANCTVLVTEWRTSI